MPSKPPFYEHLHGFPFLIGSFGVLLSRTAKSWRKGATRLVSKILVTYLKNIGICGVRRLFA